MGPPQLSTPCLALLLRFAPCRPPFAAVPGGRAIGCLLQAQQGLEQLPASHKHVIQTDVPLLGIPMVHAHRHDFVFFPGLKRVGYTRSWGSQLRAVLQQRGLLDACVCVRQSGNPCSPCQPPSDPGARQPRSMHRCCPPRPHLHLWVDVVDEADPRHHGAKRPLHDVAGQAVVLLPCRA